MVWEAVILAGSGFLGGMVNSLAGGGTLLTYPTMVWLGRDAVLANATSAVALLPGSLGGALGHGVSRAESGHFLRWLIPPSIIGGLAGAWLLLHTPSGTFKVIVPWLILSATLLMAVQERLRRHLPQGRSLAWWVGAACLQFLVGVYGGYFGAGIGILMLAVLGLLGETDIYRMNGMKNLFAVCINGCAAAWFVAANSVYWTDVAVVALASLAGGWGGAGVARRVGPRLVRRFVIAVGVIMAISLFLKP